MRGTREGRRLKGIGGGGKRGELRGVVTEQQEEEQEWGGREVQGAPGQPHGVNRSSLRRENSLPRRSFEFNNAFTPSLKTEGKGTKIYTLQKRIAGTRASSVDDIYMDSI